MTSRPPCAPEGRAATTAPHAASRYAVVAPAAFVLLWCTGYIAAKLALPDSGPLPFLTWRYLTAGALMLVLAFALRARWPGRAIDYAHAAIVGVLVHAVALGGVWIAMDLGVGAGVAALVMGTQPLLTAALAGAFVGERVGARARLGLTLGFAGIVLVVWHRLGAGIGDATGLAVTAVAVTGMTIGTLYQKRWCRDVDLVAGSVIQLAAAGVVALALQMVVADRPLVWTPAVAVALVWTVLVLSIGATTLLYVMLRRGAASGVASLFYLVPPFTALMAWAAFDEHLGATTLAGIAITTLGVALVVARGQPPRS